MGKLLQIENVNNEIIGIIDLGGKDILLKEIPLQEIMPEIMLEEKVNEEINNYAGCLDYANSWDEGYDYGYYDDGLDMDQQDPRFWNF